MNEFWTTVAIWAGGAAIVALVIGLAVGGQILEGWLFGMGWSL